MQVVLTMYPWTLDNYPYLKRGNESNEDRSDIDDYRFGITYYGVP